MIDGACGCVDEIMIHGAASRQRVTITMICPRRCFTTKSNNRNIMSTALLHDEE